MNIFEEMIEYGKEMEKSGEMPTRRDADGRKMFEPERHETRRDLVDKPEPEKAPEIDYDKLAAMIAEKMSSNMQTGTVTTETVAVGGEGDGDN